jgi:putative sterol carrier protein
MDFDNLAKKLESSFIPENARGVEAVVQLLIGGDETETWLMEIHNLSCAVHQGKSDNPRVTVHVTANDLKDLLSGKLDPMMAFFSGRVQVHGDRGFLMKIPAMFSTQELND